MSIICPTVTAFDIETYNAQMNLVTGFAPRIHVDLMDGDFTPTMSPNPDALWVPDGVEVDIHVMYRNPDSIMERLISLKPSLIIVHAESDADIPLLASKLREHGIKTGVALLPETEVVSVEYCLPHVQHSLIFGGHLGYHGGEADLSQLRKAPELKARARHIELSWDGGANIANCQILKDSGIDVINVGSGIHKAANQQSAYYELVKQIETKGK